MIRTLKKIHSLQKEIIDLKEEKTTIKQPIRNTQPQLNKRKTWNITPQSTNLRQIHHNSLSAPTHNGFMTPLIEGTGVTIMFS